MMVLDPFATVPLPPATRTARTTAHRTLPPPLPTLAQRHRIAAAPYTAHIFAELSCFAKTAQ